MKEDSQIGSSMKYINLEGLSKEQIIDKYEQLLFQREKHYKELVLQMGETNQKYIEVQDKVDELSEINESLKKDIDKTDKLIEQEQISKDIWFIKLNNLIKDYDNMKEKINHRENRNLRGDKDKRRTLSVDTIEDRSQFIRNKTMNLVGLNNKLSIDIMNIESTKTTAKKKVKKHKKENGKMSLNTTKKAKKLASENINYDPVFK